MKTQLKERRKQMAILKAPPKQPKNTTVQIRLEDELKFKLDRYAQFIEASPSYVVAEALKLVFRKDDDFTVWLLKHPANGDELDVEQDSEEEAAQ
jgi:predicted DNA-binding protein